MILEMYPSGKFINLHNFTIEDFDIRDVAHALSHICRFQGHCQRFYSVAEHCVRMVDLYKRLTALYEVELAYMLLMHDAAEAYIGDIPRPIKHAIPIFKQYENNILREIGIEYDDTVKIYDNRMLKIEARALVKSGGKLWPGFEGPLSYEETMVKQDIENLELGSIYWRDTFLNLYSELRDGDGSAPVLR